MWELIKKALNLLFVYKTECNEGKKPWQSKTVWTNIFAIIAVLLAKYADIHLNAEDIGIFLSVVNIVLRLITKSPMGFIEEEK